MKDSVLFFLIILLLIIAGLGSAVLQATGERIEQVQNELNIKTFEDCVAAGNPIMESYPRQCRTKGGKHFVEDIDAPIRNGELGGGEQCVRAGCSGELCVAASEAGDAVSTCIYLPQYACYETATCERQQGGACGWTQTEELAQCLLDARRGSMPF